MGCAAASHSFGGLSLKRWRFHCELGPLRSFLPVCGSLIMVERTPPASPLPRQPILRQQWHPAEGRGSVLPALSAAALESHVTTAQPSPQSSPEVSPSGSRDGSPERSSSSEPAGEEAPRLERSRTYVMTRTARPVSFEISFEPENSRRAADGTPFDERGVPLAIVGRRGQAAGELSWPRGVAVSGEKKPRLLVADSSNHRMQVRDANCFLSNEPSLRGVCNFSSLDFFDGRFAPRMLGCFRAERRRIPMPDGCGARSDGTDARY